VERTANHSRMDGEGGFYPRTVRTIGRAVHLGPASQPSTDSPFDGQATQRRSQPVVDVRIAEHLNLLLKSRNVVLLHPPIRGGFDRPALLEYYTSVIPEIVGTAPGRHYLKCVQPVEWLPADPPRVVKEVSWGTAARIPMERFATDSSRTAPRNSDLGTRTLTCVIAST
jgi:hypothetical protein